MSAQHTIRWNLGLSSSRLGERKCWLVWKGWQAGKLAGRQEGGGRRADTHNGAGASQHIVNRSLATMARNPLQQCPAMPTTTRGIACRERGARGNRGERERCLPPPREVTGPSLDLLPPLAAANTHLQRVQHFHVQYF